MQRLRAWLDETGTSQKTFADSLGVTQAAVSQWMGGKQTPRPNTLRAISQKTGLTIDELMGNQVVEHTTARATA